MRNGNGTLSAGTAMSWASSDGYKNDLALLFLTEGKNPVGNGLRSMYSHG
jgi:hypothetical protein